MVGVINIKGEIGQDVHLVDVIAQAEQQKEATSFDVYINSVGGIVDVGFDMYYYLKSLGKPVKTIGQELVASIATVIFMAGDSRELDLGTEFMIHMPSGGVNGTSKEIDDYNTMLKKYDKKVIDFYQETTGLSETAIRPLLDYETWLSPNLAKDLNFTTTKADNIPILAKATFNFNTENMSTLTKEDKSWFESTFNKIFNMGEKKEPVKNVIIQDSDGTEIDFINVEEGESPVVDESKANVGGQPASGEFVMPDGVIYTFTDGILTGIAEPEAPDANAERIAELEQQLAEATALAEANATAVTEKESIIAEMKKATKDLKAKITSKFEEVEPKEKKEVVVDTPVNSAKSALENLRNKRRK